MAKSNQTPPVVETTAQETQLDETVAQETIDGEQNTVVVQDGAAPAEQPAADQTGEGAAADGQNETDPVLKAEDTPESVGAGEDSPVAGQPAGDEPSQETPPAPAATVVDYVPEPVQTSVAMAAAAEPVKPGEWGELVGKVATLRNSALNDLIGTLEQFQLDLGNNSNFADPTTWARGANITYSMFQRLVTLLNSLSGNELRTGWMLLVSFVRLHRERRDAFSTYLIYRFSPVWQWGPESVDEFERLINLLHVTADVGVEGARHQVKVSSSLTCLQEQTRASIAGLYQQ